MHQNSCQLLHGDIRSFVRRFQRRTPVAIVAIAAATFFGPLAALAAPLTYTSNTTVSLTSPAINFAIVAGSTADTLVVNATSVVVTISSSTGGSFSLTSASRDLSIASSSSGGTVTQSCTSGVASTTISQSTGSSSYTITPTASACAIVLSNVNSSVPANSNSATITWTTNYPSDSTVSYGTTASYGSTASGSSGATSHSVGISGLNYSTTYHYSVSSAAGTTSATSSDATFTTGAQIIVGVGGGGSPTYSFQINNGATSTTSNVVTLSINASGASNMMISENPNFSGATWIAYAPTYAWTLSAGTGIKTIYIKVNGYYIGTLSNASQTITLLSGTAAPSPTVSTATPVSSSISALQTQLNILLATLNALIAQAQQRGIALPPGVGQLPTSATTFSRNLLFGSGGSDVKSLQLFLIDQSKGPMARKLRAVGATGYFGPLTRKALSEYQWAVGIRPASGIFGPKTRAYINSLSH